MSLLCCDVCNFSPLSLLSMRYRLLLEFLSVIILIFVHILLRLEDHLNVKNWCYSEPEGSSRHQVCDYAFMGLSSINLSELFFIVNFHPNTVL